MSTAAPTTLPRTPSRRQQPPPPAYSNGAQQQDRLHRAQSTTTRPVAPSSPRRSASTSQTSSSAPTHTRAESMRQSSGHARTQSRYADQPTPAPSSDGGPPSIATEQSRSTTQTTTTNSNLRRRTTIDATTGHWDLGKTIGAGSMGKVKLARNKATGEQVAVKIVPRGSTDGEHHSQAERDRADRSKEVRTAREAAIVTLVDHPYICGMRDVLRTNYHWYMLFEYVNGGQMLDYIISHGRLKEKQARKFGRQIASALDYCHRNSIVHRDLKIENILISKNGDIKIIDFGLSNLFSPRSHLKTFCGSLYFAAPELLQAKQYTGPEVDVWSFGIVLYVLVCGKVPFDDQSMPQLHAKIKRGNVEYPPWLTPECRGLIARMLNTNPQERATLQEIMSHPWMVKGFNGPPDNFLPVRKPIQLPLDHAVIDKMTGFDFGSAEYISDELHKLIASEDYQRAVRMQERRNAQQIPDQERKRGVFDFYKRRNSTTSRDTLNTPSMEAVQLGNDPINAFHPLISVYYLALEKQEREARENNPGALAIPQSPGEKPLALPDLPAPPAAYTNAASYEMPGEKPTGGRTRPRARTQGEDDIQDAMQNLNVNTAPSPTNPAIVEPNTDQQAPQPARKESAATSLLRRLSTRRSKEPATDRPSRGDRSHPPPSLAVFAPSDTPRKSFSVRRTRDRDPTPTGYRSEKEKAEKAEKPVEPAGQAAGSLLTPPMTGDGASEKSSRIHGLGRSISVNSSDVRRRLTRRGVSEGTSMRPPMTSSSSHDSRDTPKTQPGASRDAASDAETPNPPMAGAGMGSIASRTKSLGHGRRESMQARRTLRRGDTGRTADVPEETDRDILEQQEDLEGGGNAGSNSPTGFKPVYLKGVFSVSTTSSKPIHFIRADIIRVLSRLGVEFSEIKGGFRCRHAPSIKPGAGGGAGGGGNEDSAVMSPPPPTDATNHRRKISFGGFNRQNNAERDAFRAQQQQSQQQPPNPRGGGGGGGGSTSMKPPQRPTDPTSYENTEDESDEEQPRRPRPYDRDRDRDSNANRAAGETSTHVQTDLGSSMVLKFEIFVVKVPLIGLHGVQFKKLEGGTWQYKNMAQTILDCLRL
ncbi:Serine/threonine-protein kinase [Recurvomyces mirabilis]|uniref:non-specific serine/threonine protein kinase n=1 Tax=Recurvomyces mirabilis TaxID=574656 RepID=A0AAE0TSJ7_9PEZI|nr:Serine/threonine-protein kinase [Recurvomyces mirabilis]KAK5159853.1 Serine/threonine-protein kinase [Recurvomyces mirabilis]